DFFDADLLRSIMEQSNLYRTQQNPTRALKLDQNELESRMYWSRECRVPWVADLISRERWEETKHFIHFSDNMTPNNGERLFKVRPLIDSLLSKFQALPQDQMSIDEQTVPFKGRSSLKQYIPKKPYKWGYKIFVLCDTKDLMHSFDIFSGKTDPAPGQPDIGASGNVVLKLAQVIHGAINHLLYFDNWFSSLDLFVALANKGILALGTVRQNRLQGCTFKQRAVIDSVEVRAVKWFDNRGVIVASAHVCGIPSIISLYKKFLGGVDALDALTTYYRIHIRPKKYYHRLFCHFVDMMIVNSWLLYRRDYESPCVPRKLRRGGGLHWMLKESSKRRNIEVQLRLFQHRRCDQMLRVTGQWLKGSGNDAKAQNVRARLSFKCSKCNVHQCLNKNLNCFCEFHEF
uniref:PiggyBac transposable element-derived protein domain-containing protein n=1 Tax=Mola mola TaxID=94237 RepID=A0A3Q3VTB7_MOLML